MNPSLDYNAITKKRRAYDYEDALSQVQSGWHGIIDAIYDYINEIYIAYGILVLVTEVKEKFGALRIYYTIENCTDYEACELVSEELDRLIDQSETTCEDCGKIGSMRLVYGWNKTLCDVCYMETVNASD